MADANAVTTNIFPTDTPTNSGVVEKELRQVRALMQLEQKEDLAQFKLKNAQASIVERQRRGFTWYPITITKEDIGFGGKVMLELEGPAGEQGMEGLHLFQVGRNASLFSNAPVQSNAACDPPALSGVITSQRRNKLLLATTKEELPDGVFDDGNVEGGKLEVDLTKRVIDLETLTVPLVFF